MARRTDSIELLNAEVTTCTACPRLVAWREACAADPPRRFLGEDYWARPLPGFGDPAAPLLVVGLAPAAHGGNRTGRIFTGDRSGDFLFAALHRAGLANQPTSTHRDDGLTLFDTWITAAVRCAPPANKPTPAERDTCIETWARPELAELPDARVMVCLGQFAWDAALRLLDPPPRPKPKFGHGTGFDSERWTMLGCFHPSQQNTFTGVLTEPMIDDVFEHAKVLAGVAPA
jgi:uracil-DNA glycosylase